MKVETKSFDEQDDVEGDERSPTFFEKIQTLEIRWRNYAEFLDSNIIRDVREKLEAIKGGAAGISAIAKSYENPVLPQIGIREDGLRISQLFGEEDNCPLPEPLDEASEERQKGASTFNICGWCKHARDGQTRFHYFISTHCSIKTAAGLPDEKRYFNTPCFLQKDAPSEFAQLQQGLEQRLTYLVKERKEAVKDLLCLARLLRRVEQDFQGKAPHFPCY